MAGEKTHTDLSMKDTFEKRRKFPRLKMSVPVTITGTRGEIFRAALYDISPDGVQVRLAISDGMKIFPGKESPVDDIKSLLCTLQLDLAYCGSVSHVKIDAHTVCVRTVDDNTLACGMFFSEKELSENKKISDFLFYHVYKSFSEIEYTHAESGKVKNELETRIHKSIIEGKKQSHENEDVKIVPSELEKLILQTDHSKETYEVLKQLLINVLTGLKVIQETTRHIDEKLYLIENKISKK